jgi:hypothetical protein
MLNQADHFLGKEMAKLLMEQTDNKSKIHSLAKYVQKEKAETKEKRHLRSEKRDEKKFCTLLAKNDYSSISDQEINSLSGLVLSEHKLIQSLNFLEKIGASNKKMAGRLCILYGSKLEEYGMLEKELNKLLTKLRKNESVSNKVLISYLATQIQFISSIEQKEILLGLAETTTELSDIRKTSLKRLDKIDLTDQDLSRLFLLSQDIELQRDIFSILLRRNTFSREVVMKAIAEEITKGNLSLFYILNYGVHMGY